MPSCFGFRGAAVGGGDEAPIAVGLAVGAGAVVAVLPPRAPPVDFVGRNGATGEAAELVEAAGVFATTGCELGSTTAGAGTWTEAAVAGTSGVAGAPVSTPCNAVSPGCEATEAAGPEEPLASHTPSPPSAATVSATPAATTLLPAPPDELGPAPVFPHDDAVLDPGGAGTADCDGPAAPLSGCDGCPGPAPGCCDGSDALCGAPPAPVSGCDGCPGCAHGWDGKDGRSGGALGSDSRGTPGSDARPGAPGYDNRPAAPDHPTS